VCSISAPERRDAWRTRCKWNASGMRVGSPSRSSGGLMGEPSSRWIRETISIIAG
jgi:hypothetical protein